MDFDELRVMVKLVLVVGERPAWLRTVHIVTRKNRGYIRDFNKPGTCWTFTNQGRFVISFNKSGVY